MSLYIQYKNQSLNEFNINNITSNNFNFNIFNSEYIQQKIKELLLKTLPTLKSASIKIIDICLKIILKFVELIFDKIKQIDDNIKDTIQNFFHKIYNFISTFFNDNINQEFNNSNGVNVSLNNISNKLSKVDVDISSKEIINYLQQEKALSSKNDKNQFIIDKNDMQRIQDICQLDNTQLFTIEDEDNYLCLPMTDENDNLSHFKAIKVTNYYLQSLNLTDRQFDEIMSVIEQFFDNKDKLKDKKEITFLLNSFDFISLVFRYKSTQEIKDLNIFYKGAYIHKRETQNQHPIDERIEVIVNIDETLNLDKSKFLQKVIGTLHHEVSHKNDSTVNPSTFTSYDFASFINLLKLKYGQDKKSINIKEIEQVLKEINPDEEWGNDAFKTLIAIAQKQGYIKYDNNYKDIVFLINKDIKDNKKALYNFSPKELHTQLISRVYELLEEMDVYKEIDACYNQILKSLKKKAKNKSADSEIINNEIKKLFNVLLKPNPKSNTQVQERQKDITFNILLYSRVYTSILIDEKEYDSETDKEADKNKISDNVYKKFIIVFKQIITKIINRKLNKEN